MRTIHAAGVLALALIPAFALLSGSAHAQAPAAPPPPAPSPPPAKTSEPLALQKQQLGTVAFAAVARARMRSGDCAGALDAFDAAIGTSVDPTLRRDRGLCHEQLGHPYPAIDDYRAYLTEEPEAPDAEGIRVRLGRLEQSTSGKSSEGEDDDVPPSAPALGEGSATASGSVTVGIGTSESSSSEGAQATPGSAGTPRDSFDDVDRDTSEMHSPLRRGKGFSFAPYFSEHKWFTSGASFGESDTWAECVGLQLRYSVSRVSTLFVEGAYQHFNSTSASTDSASGDIQGLTSQLGIEFRFFLDPEGDHQFLLAPGLGFDHIVLTSNLAGGLQVSEGALIPRVRFGWRAMIAASAGIDLSLDAGVGKFAQYSTGDFPFGGPGQETALVALNVGLLWGL